MYAYTYLKGIMVIQSYFEKKLVNVILKKIYWKCKQLVRIFLLIIKGKNSDLDYKINDIVFIYLLLSTEMKIKIKSY